MGNKPKLPPLPQPGADTPEGKFLDALKKVRTSGGTPISDDEIRHAKANSQLASQGAIYNAEKRVWRTPGKAGAGYDRPPLSVENARAEQRYRTEGNKVHRKLKLLVGNPHPKGHTTAKGDNTRQEVFRLKEEGIAVHAIATRLNITQARVRQILNEP